MNQAVTFDVAAVLSIYLGSDGEATKRLYTALEQFGPIGVIATNLLRACKASERAKAYRGGGYRGDAYRKKEWSLANLCEALAAIDHLTFAWGWGLDDKQPFHKHVLYVDLPTGQVSFHSADRGEGPDYGKPWDGRAGQSAGRICAWAARLLAPPAADSQGSIDG